MHIVRSFLILLFVVSCSGGGSSSSPMLMTENATPPAPPPEPSISFDEAGYKVIGMDLNEERINQLKSNYDKTNEINKDRLTKCKIKFTTISKLDDPRK